MTVKRDITIKAADGTARAGLFRNDTATAASRAGVVLYMDVFGPRAAMDAMAERLAGAGYLVLVPDLFYRSGEYSPVAEARTVDEATRKKFFGMMGATSQDMTKRDSAAFIEALTSEGATGKIGTVGYCMGGSRAMHAAAAYPDRVAAAASFHGGGLASDAPDSPHREVGSIRGRVYDGSAGDDGSFPPDQSARLAEALRTAEIDHLIENYVGMAHGWTVPDHGAFNETGAERHWTRLLTLFQETLQ
jgi:carboxymethylenebutenolidase